MNTEVSLIAAEESLVLSFVTLPVTDISVPKLASLAWTPVSPKDLYIQHWPWHLFSQDV
jgi:hypothetical protein